MATLDDTIECDEEVKVIGHLHLGDRKTGQISTYPLWERHTAPGPSKNPGPRRYSSSESEYDAYG